ncbi:MAG: hypothetical protein ACK5YB_14585 [Burkholderiales bacterium]
MTLFRLSGTYEAFVGSEGSQRLVRIEVLVSLKDHEIYRARVWVQSTYNLYPTFLNLGKDGADLKQVHSSDQLNAEITSLIADDPSWATGIACSSEQAFLDQVCRRIETVLRE